MPGFVRAKDPVSGAEMTVAAEYAEAQGLDVLAEKAALDEYGRPRPAKPRTDLAAESSQGAAIELKSAHRRGMTEEN